GHRSPPLQRASDAGGQAQRLGGERRRAGEARTMQATADSTKMDCVWSNWKSQAIDLLYWRDIKQTGIVFGSFLLLLFSLTQFSVVSVVAYLALAALSATISFRIYKSVLQAVQKTDEGHPFKAYLELEITLSQEQIQKYTDCLQLYVNSTLKELRRLFLVQDLVDTLKFAVLMWLLTYVGALFNGLTLLLMAVVSMFTLPVVYVKHQAQIDQYLGLVRTHINAVVAKIQAKIPGAKRHTE
ncbi:reticulon family protein, partial [Salmonella enterica]|nr:reticulon family protein [Salmonella enterica]